MKVSTVILAGLLGLDTMAVQGGLLPVRAGCRDPRNINVHVRHPVAVRQIIQMVKGTGNTTKQMDEIQTVVPSNVIFHETNVTTATNGGPLVNTTANAPINGTTGVGWPHQPANITACTAPVYEDKSPLRTKIIRDDCEDLLKKVITLAGYWEMGGQWNAIGGGDAYTGLISEGTCQFAVSRRMDEKLVHDQGQFANASMSMGGVTNNTDVAIIGNEDVYNVLHAAVYDYAYQADEPYMDRETTQGHMYCQFQGAPNATLAFKLQYVDYDSG